MRTRVKVAEGCGSRAALKLTESARRRRHAVNAPHFAALVSAGFEYVPLVAGFDYVPPVAGFEHGPLVAGFEHGTPVERGQVTAV